MNQKVIPIDIRKAFLKIEKTSPETFEVLTYLLARIANLEKAAAGLAEVSTLIDERQSLTSDTLQELCKAQDQALTFFQRLATVMETPDVPSRTA